MAAVEEFAAIRDRLNMTLRENIQLAQERQKHYADKRRAEKSFNEGEFVFFKLQPYRQTSLALRKNLKLAAWYYGPYKILVSRTCSLQAGVALVCCHTSCLPCLPTQEKGRGRLRPNLISPNDE
ncbi:hypothetical protein Dimus_039409 [Dionaea muscipula]